MTSDYKKYSLEQLESWIHDALSATEATPQEIYNVIRGVVEEQYYEHKSAVSRSYELLSLLNGKGKNHSTSWDEWEATYYPEEVKDDGMRPWGHSDMEYLIANQKKDNVKKWVLPVELDGLTGDCFISLPDDLLEAANLKEGDQVEWVDNGYGSWLFRKVTKPLQIDEC